MSARMYAHDLRAHFANDPQRWLNTLNPTSTIVSRQFTLSSFYLAIPETELAVLVESCRAISFRTLREYQVDSL